MEEVDVFGAAKAVAEEPLQVPELVEAPGLLLQDREGRVVGSLPEVSQQSADEGAE